MFNRKLLKLLPLLLILVFAASAFGAATLTPDPKFTQIDSNGDPLSGGKVYFFETGTSTPKTTWTDAAKGTPNANPVILDSNGQANIWIDSTGGQYRVRVDTSADITQWGPVDNIDSMVTGNVGADAIFLIEHTAAGRHFAPDSFSYTDFATAVSTIGATETSLIISTSEAVTGNVTVPATLELVFRQGGELNISGAIVVTVNGPIASGLFQIFTGAGTVVFGNGYFHEAYPQWWGATGDGVTDDTAAMQAWVDSNVQDGVLVEGTYLANIDVDGRMNIRGSGPRTIIKAVTTDPVITILERRDAGAGTDDLWPGRKLYNFKVDGNGKAGKCISFTLRSVQDHIEHITFKGCTRGLEFASSVIGTWITYSTFRDSDYGIYMIEETSVSGVNLNLFDSNRFLEVDTAAIYIAATTVGASGNIFRNNWFESLEGFGLIIKSDSINSFPNVLEDNWWEDVAGTTPITLDDEGSVTSYVIWLDTVPMTQTAGAFPAKSLINDSQVSIIQYRGSGSLITGSQERQLSLTGASDVEIENATFSESGGSGMVGSATGSLVVNKPRTLTKKRGFITEGLSMINNVYGYTKIDGIQTLIVNGGSTLTYQNDSLYESGVIRAALTADAHRIFGATQTLVDDKWYVITFALKSSSSSDEPDITFTVTGTGTAFGSQTIRARGDRWTQYVNIFGGDSTAVTGQIMRFGVSTGETATFDIARLQFIQFDTKAAAEAFIHNQYYAVSPGKINTLANDATPDVISDERSSVWLTGGTTTITDFDNGFIGQEIIVIAEHTLDITDGTNIFTPTGGNLTMNATDTLTLIQKADGKWYTIAYSDNT